VHTDADLEPERLRAGGDRLAAPDRPCRTVEGRQKPVAERLDLPATGPRELASPSSEARFVEATMSVNITVASTRSMSVRVRLPVRNSSISPSTASLSPAHGR